MAGCRGAAPERQGAAPEGGRGGEPKERPTGVPPTTERQPVGLGLQGGEGHPAKSLGLGFFESLLHIPSRGV